MCEVSVLYAWLPGIKQYNEDEMNRIISLFLVGTMLAGAESYAAGFAIKETDSGAAGHAFAGNGAMMGNIASMWNNPATMTGLKESGASLSVMYIMPNATFKQSGEHDASGVTAKSSENAAVPAFYGLWSLNDRTKVGLAVTAPFGMSVDFGADSMVSELVMKSSMISYNINPSIAYRVNKHFSVALGVSAQRIEVEKTQKLSDRTLNAIINKNAGPPSAAISGQQDVAKLTGDAWGYGYNLGFVLEPFEGTVFGLSYRSQINCKLDGKVQFNNLLVARNGWAKTDISTPASIDFSMTHEINKEWKAMFSAVWTNWSVFDKLDVKTEKDIGEMLETHNWSNAWFFAVGFNYVPHSLGMEDIVVKFGAAYDQTPVHDVNRRPGIPDADRYLVSAGVDYMVNDRCHIGFSYTHLFMQNAKVIRQHVDNYGEGKDKVAGYTPHIVDGSFHSNADIIGVHINYKF